MSVNCVATIGVVRFWCINPGWCTFLFREDAMQAKINEERIYRILKNRMAGILINGICMIVISLLLRFLCNKTDLLTHSILLYRIYSILSVIFIIPGSILLTLGIVKGVKLRHMHKMPIMCTAGVIVAKRENLICVEFDDKSLHNFILVCSKKIEKGDSGIIFHKCGMIYDFR